MINKIKDYLKQSYEQFNEQFCKSQSNFEKIMENEAKFPKENIWNCKYCTNAYNGCKKCNPDNLRSSLHILSQDYYSIEKIKCKCELQEIPGCDNCKQKGFLLLRIFNFSPFKRKKKYDLEFEQEFCDSNWEINMLKEQCKNYLEKQNEKYFVIDEKRNSYENILNCEFVAEFEKEKYRKLKEKAKEGNVNLINILKESGTIEKVSKVLQERFLKDLEKKKDVNCKLDCEVQNDLTCVFP